ncbi:hypothetical protein GCM10010505_63620 [Kitasatospora aburaviensis]
MASYKLPDRSSLMSVLSPWWVRRHLLSDTYLTAPRVQPVPPRAPVRRGLSKWRRAFPVRALPVRAFRAGPSRPGLPGRAGAPFGPARPSAFPSAA